MYLSSQIRLVLRLVLIFIRDQACQIKSSLYQLKEFGNYEPCASSDVRNQDFE